MAAYQYIGLPTTDLHSVLEYYLIRFFTLFFAMHTSFLYYSFPFHVQVLGLEVDAKDYVGMAPLMWAAYNNQPQNIALLMELGANVALQDIDGMSAIHWAVQKSDIEALRVCALAMLETSLCKLYIQVQLCLYPYI